MYPGRNHHGVYCLGDVPGQQALAGTKNPGWEVHLLVDGIHFWGRIAERKGRKAVGLHLYQYLLSVL